MTPERQMIAVDRAAGAVVIDTMMGDLSGLTAAFLIPARRPALVETGPGRSVRHVRRALDRLGLGPDDLAYIVVTHVHLDHAGAAGELARTFAAARVVVHPAGARHLADPSRLVASAARVHGPLMDSVYGSMAPVPAGRLQPAADGDRLDLGDRSLRLLHTPGHAAHHLAVLDESTGTLLPGDAAGVLVAPMTAPRPATPPPDFDRDAALTSLRRLRSRHPQRLLLTHFGRLDQPDHWLGEAEEGLRRWSAVALAAVRRGAGPAGLERALLAAFGDEDGLAADPARFAVFGGFAANAAGLHRWARRAPA